MENGTDCSLEDKAICINEYGVLTMKNKETVFHLLAKIRFVTYVSTSTTTQKEMENIIRLLTKYYVISPKLREEIERLYESNVPLGYSLMRPCPLSRCC